MRFLIFGAGSLGCVAGGLLAKQGHDVALVGRERVVAALCGRGVRITGIWGEHAIGPLRASNRAADFADESHDVVLVAVKSFDTAAAVDAVAPCVGPDTLEGSYARAKWTQEGRLVRVRLTPADASPLNWTLGFNN
jgi:2-dehydropantoate 2-reductase